MRCHTLYKKIQDNGKLQSRGSGLTATLESLDLCYKKNSKLIEIRYWNNAVVYVFFTSVTEDKEQVYVSNTCYENGIYR